MSDSALKAAYEEALTLPEGEQAEVAEMLEHFVDQRTSALRLAPEQIEENRRRLNDPSPEYAAGEEVDTFFRRALNED
jgi:hypothetical protein